MSNFEYLKTRKTIKPTLQPRVKALQDTAAQLREYLKRASKAKRNQILALICEYETLAENLQSKLELKGI